MSKHLIIILLSLIFGLLSSAGSQTLWTKYPGNPVLEPGPSGEWDYSLLSPTILHKDNLYHMWYAGYNVQDISRIGYATSPSGTTWTKYDDPATTNPPYSYSDPVIHGGSPGEWDQEISSPSVFWNETDSLFHMWYMAGTGAPHDSRIGYATSSNGTTWTKYNDPTTTNPPYAESDPVLFPGPNSWDASWVGGPWVLLIGNEYHMWYHAYSGSGNITRFGHATSSDGITWEKDINNPVLEPDPGTWDYPDLRRASVVFMESDSLYHMFYSGGVWSATNWQVGHATTVHPDSAWHKDTLNNPVLPSGPVGSWDAISASFCGVLVENSNQVKMWYSGTNDGIIAKFGLATSPVVLNIPGNFPTIQEAINAANDGNVVLVEEGNYYENINFKGKAITVASRFLVDDDTSHISNTIIDGSQPSHSDSGSVVVFVSGEDTTSILYGFTITSGSGTYDAQWQARDGGGIYCLNSGCKIINNKIINNTVNDVYASGGGLAAYADEPLPSVAYVILDNNKIDNNTVNAGTGSANGGGIFMYCNGKIVENTISNNECFSNAHLAAGGGLDCYSDNTIDPHSLIIIRNNFSHNSAISNASGLGYPEAQGGGMRIRGFHVLMQGNHITYNTLNSSNSTSGGGFRMVGSNYSSIIDGNYIKYNNSISTAGGIGIHTSDPIMTNNIVAENSGVIGGGILFYQSNPQEFINNTVVNNQATSQGGGMRIWHSNLISINNIIWGNQAPVGSQIQVYTGSNLQAAYCNIQGSTVWPGEGNISKEPMLRGDYFELSDSSSSIGAGIDSIQIGGIWYHCPPTCYLSHSRPTPADSMPDMGACESPLGSPVVGIDKQLSNNLPISYDLKQNYPNPFNPTTVISWQLPVSSSVKLTVYNIAGQKVATLVDERQPAGSHSIEWDASGLASAVYIYHLEADQFIQSRKMILMK